MRSRPVPVLFCWVIFACTCLYPLMATGQDIIDYTALGQPDYAQRLGLSDEQVAEIAVILDDRLKALAAKPVDRQEVLDAANQKLEKLLTPSQKEKFAELVAGGKLRFNFREESWTDVLDWFAGQAGLSLIMDTAPAGSFTYSDAKNYTPTEAIDLLNSVLQSKGFTLVRREKMLIVAATTDEGIPYDMVPKVTVEELADRGRFEFVSVLFDLESRPVDTVAKEVEAFLGTHGRATPLAQTGQLLVIDTAGRVSAIHQLIQSIPQPKEKAGPKSASPQPKPPAPVLQVHSTEGLDVNAAIKTLRDLFADAKFTGDERAEQITAFATPAMQEAIAKALAQMTSNVSGDAAPRLEIYSVVDQELDQLQAVLTQTTPGVQVTAEAETDRLFVVGDEKQQQAVQATLEKMDVMREQSDETLTVYDVQPQLSEQLVELLQPLLPRASIAAQGGRIAVRGRPELQRMAQRAIEQFEAAQAAEERPSLRFYQLPQPLDPSYLDTLQQLAPEARISAVRDRQQLAVVALTKDHEKIATTLQQVQADLQQQLEKTLKFYPASKDLRERFQKLQANLEERLVGVQLIWDYAPEEMAAYATVPGHAALSQVLDELRRETDGEDLQLQRFEVDVEDPQRLLSLLQQRFPSTELLLSEGHKSLLAWTETDQMDEIKREVDRLVAVLPRKQVLLLKTYSVQALHLAELPSLLKTMAESATFTMDAANGRLIVRASAEDHEQIASTLETLQRDFRGDSQRVLIAYPVRRNDVAAVVQMLRELRPELALAVDERANQILATASLLDHAKLGAIIRQLDVQPDQTNEDVARSYIVKSLPPTTVVQLLQSAVPKLRLTPNDSQQQIAAWGPAFAHERLKLAIAQLDQADVQGRVVSYEIGTSDATAVRNVLLQLVPRAIVSTNPETRSVVVWAGNDDQALVGQAIEAFTAQQSAQHRTLKSYDLPRGMGDTVLAVVRAVAPAAEMDIDQSEGKVVVWGSEPEHAAVTQALKDLAASQQQSLEIYELGDLSRELAASALSEAFSHVAVLDSPDPQKLLVLAAPEDQPRIAETLQQLIQTAPTRQQLVKVYPIDRAKTKAETVYELLGETLREKFSIQINDDSNSLVARGRESDQAELASAIHTIVADLPTIPRRETRVYSLEYADPDNAETILRDLLPAARIVDNEQTRTISATAVPEEHVQIQRVLEQLDVPKRQRIQRTTEVYRFDRTSADSTAAAFEDLAPDARVSLLRESNAVIATGTQADHALFRQLVAKLEGHDAASVVQVYPLDKEQIDAEDVVDSIDQALRSRLAIRINEAMNSVIVRGSSEDQLLIRNTIEEIVKQVPPRKQRLTKVYRLQHGSGQSAQTVLREMFEDASIVFDEATATLSATATAERQQAIASLITQMDQPAEEGKPTRVYRLRSADAAQVAGSLSNLVADGQVAFDDATNSLIVTANSRGHERLQGVVNALDGLQEEGLQTEVYSLQSADPGIVRSALEPLLPQARISSDANTASLIVAGNSADHARVREVVSRLDQVPTQQPLVKAYLIKSADAKSVHQSLANTFAGNSNFSISFQEPTKSLFVVATPKNHALFAELLAEIDQPSLTSTSRAAKVYSLTNVDGNAARAAVTSLLQDTSPAATVEFEAQGSSLIVVGTAEQHRLAASTLEQLAGEESLLEVFNLDYVDPWTVETAINSLFEGQSASSTPTVSSDYTSQRLFVRGTQRQIDQVKTLLGKMGETSAAIKTGTQGDVRTIPFRGDVDAALEQVRQLWPRIRQNRIQVITPSEPELRPLPRDPASGTQFQRPDQGLDRKAPSPTRTRFVAAQESTEGEPSPADAKRADESNLVDSPVVIIPQPDRITIASSDHEALDQLESILRAISRTEGDNTGIRSDFAVFLLRNTGASDMRQLLADLFEQLRSSSAAAGTLGQTNGFPTFGPSFGDVAVVADDRLNALIIHGDRKERELIEELLRVLDSKDLPNPIIVFQPELVSLQNTQAERVLAILKNVYRSQLTSGGGRKTVEIPEGVSAEVASVLQQINAASSAPVLTLDIDETTNSIVMRAPPELRQEIKAFVQMLDGEAATNRRRNVRVIRLQASKADRIREALERFMLQRE